MIAKILIAPSAALPMLREQPDLREAMAFNDTHTEEAVDAIRLHAPCVVAVERSFIETANGQALLQQLRSETALQVCRVERVGVRRASRHKPGHEIGIAVDGEPARLIDISTLGCLVLTRTSLKPQQRVRVTLREATTPITGKVVWAQFELPAEGPRYRAGVEFGTSAEGSVQEFIGTLPT